MSHVVSVPVARLDRWVANFSSAHGDTALTATGGRLVGAAADGSTFTATLPFGRSFGGPAEADAFAAAAAVPPAWGVLLVRKGGFAVARLSGDALVDSKVGQRHVQGRTKAGGQSQQRFARRRDNQARQAFEAAAGHAVRVLLAADLDVLVTGGDHAAVDAVLSDPRLAHLAERVVNPWLPVPDPRRSVLDQAVADASAIRLTVVNAPERDSPR